ncbi:TldD [candidate division WOR_3 bacterium SM23_42]|uniref:TldD n=1 Tax=candidate division WOR_3 bacterium SM23_42 TaxID=1703779 RepID=A0A0S8FSY3_UNCW3|nr:MAG: TldD [candidate division WOR_3 bacterium SM23_42]
MFDTLKSILSKIQAEYADIRHEIKKETRIAFNGKELTEIGTNTTDGYVLRILHKGGFSSVAFTDPANHERAIRTALENADLMTKFAAHPVVFKSTDIIKDEYIPNLIEDPRKITIDEKLQLTRRYNEMALNNEKVATTNINYVELIREKHFISTEGSEIKEELITTRISGLITSRDGNLIQNVRVGAGGSNGFAILKTQEDRFEKKSRIAVDLLKAQPVRGGRHNAIVNQNLGGVFTHEAFGHFSEADIIEHNRSMREKMQIGATLGSDIVDIVDDPTLPNQLGHYKYDDEGVAAQRTQLLKNGVVAGRLHSRRTAAAFQEPLSGHCIAEDYRYAPIIRMGTIFIEPGANDFDTLLDKLGNGLYILDAKGGQTSGENFTFGAQYGYLVENGKLGKMVRDINISGNLYNTLKNITAIGNDLQLSQTGGCGKGQTNIRSCFGTPHLIINDLIIGGV